MSRLQIIFCFSIYFPPRIFLGRFFVAPDIGKNPKCAFFWKKSTTGGYSKLMSFEYVHVYFINYTYKSCCTAFSPKVNAENHIIFTKCDFLRYIKNKFCIKESKNGIEIFAFFSIFMFIFLKCHNIIEVILQKYKNSERNS